LGYDELCVFYSIVGINAKKTSDNLEIKMKNDKYLGRGIHKEQFLDSLTSGKLKPMLEIINKDKDLDVQIRNNYLNIYYDGGNIAKVSSANSVLFNKNYFYTDMKNNPAKDINRETKDILSGKRNELICKFKEGNFKEYFDDAKKIMNIWFAANPKPERKEQHQLSIENQYNKSDYTIIDLEYQVSMESKFYCTFVPEGKSKPKKPRFDIIAVDKAGKLCVIELKSGTGALGNTSGLKEHYECYKCSIGRNPEPFKSEMENLLSQKQDFGLIDDRLKILSTEPEFMFVYSYDESDKKAQFNKFMDEYNVIGENIHVIWLQDKSWKLLDK
tara:strand:- start:4418 stop:5404 length:987 start_codon:yes stop_codon:yes gene_type:complete